MRSTVKNMPASETRPQRSAGAAICGGAARARLRSTGRHSLNGLRESRTKEAFLPIRASGTLTGAISRSPRTLRLSRSDSGRSTGVRQDAGIRTEQ